MRKTKTITGIVVYKNIGTGFWGIEGLNGEEWLPVNLPIALQEERKRVRLKVKVLEGENFFMWGEMVEVVE